MRRFALHVAVTLAVAIPLTCASEDEGYTPEQFCPGGPDCKDDDGPFRVGAAAVKITPTIDGNTEVLTVDVDNDGEFDFREDEFDDKNGNGRFDGVWIGGFGYGRGASSVNDDQWARAIALTRGETTIVLVSIDAVGYFYDEVDAIRQNITDLGVDFLSVSATHSHESRDTLGIWGLSEDESGLDPAYMTFLRAQIEAAVRAAVAEARPAHIKYATLRTRDLPGGMLRYQSDARDPKIIDDEVRLLQFTEAGSATTIATLINWGSHPEYIGDENQALSSDYPHWLREGIENGVTGPNGQMRAGVGGVAVFFTGALGSQIGPGRVRPADLDGVAVSRNSIAAAEAVGTQIAYHALGALSDSTVVDEDAAIGFSRESFFIDIQNRAYHTALLKELFVRQGYNWDEELVLLPGQNEPDVITEVSTIDIGRAQIISVPGELDPSLFLGGYDGAYTPAGEVIVDTSTHAVNPPDLSLAPGGPYLKDLARADAEYVFVFGLANDMLGYFLPEFDYELHPRNPYFDEAPGDHYEETNSVGVDGWPTVHDKLRALLSWRASR